MPSNILIVDDEATLRNLVERFLAEEKYQTQRASNGQAAMKCLQKERFDLVILDLLLPGLAGEELCHRIRQDAQIRDLPILVMTGMNSQGVEARLLNLGADDFIAKPFEREGFLAHVRALLRRSRVFQSGDYILRTQRMTIHMGERKVLLDGKPIQSFAPKEFGLLKNIIQQSPNVIEKSLLAEKVWGMSLEQLHYRMLDVHIQRVRKKTWERSLSMSKNCSCCWLSVV